MASFLPGRSAATRYRRSSQIAIKIAARTANPTTSATKVYHAIAE
jgi:hypothetical protein